MPDTLLNTFLSCFSRRFLIDCTNERLLCVVQDGFKSVWSKLQRATIYGLN